MDQSPYPPLPIAQVLPELRTALSAGAVVVLQAPPGAGKTTGFPLALLEEAWLAGQRVVMLEPRRVAARAAARRMASTLAQSAGQTVGFRVRGETRVGIRTRIEVVTEGVFTRWLLTDPLLEHVGLVIFDEFHERSSMMGEQRARCASRPGPACRGWKPFASRVRRPTSAAAGPGARLGYAIGCGCLKRTGISLIARRRRFSSPTSHRRCSTWLRPV